MQEWSDVANVQVLEHSTNRGKGAAVRTGLAYATGEVVVIQDADLEYDPADLSKLIEPFRDDAVLAVYGIRYSPHARLPWTKFRLAVALLNGLVRLLYGQRIHDEATCYKVVRRSLLEQMHLSRNGFRPVRRDHRQTVPLARADRRASDFLSFAQLFRGQEDRLFGILPLRERVAPRASRSKRSTWRIVGHGYKSTSWNPDDSIDESGPITR